MSERVTHIFSEITQTSDRILRVSPDMLRIGRITIPLLQRNHRNTLYSLPTDAITAVALPDIQSLIGIAHTKKSHQDILSPHIVIDETGEHRHLIFMYENHTKPPYAISPMEQGQWFMISLLREDVPHMNRSVFALWMEGDPGNTNYLIVGNPGVENMDVMMQLKKPEG